MVYFDFEKSSAYSSGYPISFTNELSVYNMIANFSLKKGLYKVLHEDGGGRGESIMASAMVLIL